MTSTVGVVGHVLGLEGRDTKAVLAEDAAESRYQHALPHVGGGALDHQDLSRHLEQQPYGHEHSVNLPFRDGLCR